MNDLESAKCLDFVLHLASEVVPKKDSKPEYQIVWQLNGRLVSADALLYNGDEPQAFEIDKHYEVSKHSMYVMNNEMFLLEIRDRFSNFFKLEEPFNRFGSLYFKDSVLLDRLIDFVSKLGLEGSTGFDDNLYNVEFLDSGTKLPFMKLSSEDKIKAVSLMKISDTKVSEN